MQKNENPFIDDNFAKHIGIELIDSAPNSARAQLRIQNHHLNGTGTVHGGAIFSLAVWTMAVAANQDAAQLSVGLNADISYLRPARSGTLIAEAKLTADAPKVATWNVAITDQDGETIAIFKGLAYKKLAHPGNGQVR